MNGRLSGINGLIMYNQSRSSIITKILEQGVPLLLVKLSILFLYFPFSLLKPQTLPTMQHLGWRWRCVVQTAAEPPASRRSAASQPAQRSIDSDVDKLYQSGKHIVFSRPFLEPIKDTESQWCPNPATKKTRRRDHSSEIMGLITLCSRFVLLDGQFLF